MVNTVIHILSAVVSSEAKKTLTLIVGVVVETSSTILAGIEFLAAEGNLALTVLACKPWMTLTPVLFNKVNTGRVVLTFTLHTVIYVDLTAVTLKTSRTVAAEASSLQDLTGAKVPAGVSITCINLVLAVGAIKCRCTFTLIAAVGKGATGSSILTWVCVAKVTLCQDLIRD